MASDVDCKQNQAMCTNLKG